MNLITIGMKILFGMPCFRNAYTNCKSCHPEKNIAENLFAPASETHNRLGNSLLLTCCTW